MVECAIVTIKINVRGLEVSVSSPGEAAALIRELTEPATPKIGRPPKAEQYAFFHDAIRPAEDRVAIEFLQVLESAPPAGPSIEEIMRAVGVTTGRGIGGRMVRINNILLRAGFEPIEVYQNPKGSEGRKWTAGPKLQEALLKLKKS